MKAKFNSIIATLQAQFQNLHASLKSRFNISKKFIWRVAIVLGVIVLGVMLASFLWQTPEFRTAVQDTRAKLGDSMRSARRRLTRKPINLLVMQEALVTDDTGTVIGIEGDTIPAEATPNGRG